MFSSSPQHLFRGTQGRHVGVSDRLRGRSQDECGFSLIEVLVVALILGVLAAIAIPVFAAQKGKAVDAQAKALARTAETTAEVVATDNNGEYTNVSTAELNKAEPSIRVVSSTADAYLSAASGTTNTYLVTAKATDGNEFTISRRATGEITRSCKSPTTGCGGAATGSW